MKTYIAILLLCLASGALLANRQRPYIATRVEAARQASGGGGGGCTTARDTVGTTSTGTFPFGGSSARQMAAVGTFTAGASTTICRIDIPLWKSGSPTFTMTAVIYTDNGMGTAPSTQVGTASSGIDASTLSTSEPGTWVSFTGASCAITSGTQYWVVVTTSAQDGQVEWPHSGSFGSGHEMTYNGSVWSEEASRQGHFALFSN